MYVTNNYTRKKEMNVYKVLNEVEIKTAHLINDLLIDYNKKRTFMLKEEFAKKVYSFVDYQKLYKSFKQAFNNHLHTMSKTLPTLNYDNALNYDLTKGYNDFVEQLDSLLDEFIDNAYKSYRIAIDKFMVTKPNLPKKQQEIINYYAKKALLLNADSVDSTQKKLENKDQDKYKDLLTDSLKLLVGIGIHNAIVKKKCITSIVKNIDTPTGKWSLANKGKKLFNYNLNMALREQTIHIYKDNNIEKVIYKHRGSDTPCSRCEPHINKEYTLQEAMALIPNVSTGEEYKVIFHEYCHCWLIPIEYKDKVNHNEKKEHLPTNQERKKNTQKQLDKYIYNLG